ncbi:SDH family Clp fold serine proteinase [Amycolatopsis benzoatilytica]|uniref:SDH family Clp fold serine proteinase n=1 Tax=Amycolatopsis benzoatilytica TaxID=346045 RepID=UPI00036CCB5B|nr:hypothetical protein [Amycolatopsis benzoatilytica]
MNDEHAGGTAAADERASALDVGLRAEAEKMTFEEYQRVVQAGHDLAQCEPGIWLLISGKFVSDNKEKGTEGHLKDMLRGAFGYPEPEDAAPETTLHVLLDSPGGSLDSAYSSAMYLAKYAKTVKVYVPNRAKSASTLLALGADELYLSPFGELGPLDTQIADPRNPASLMSALDCYQSVDYVSDFAIRTFQLVLPELLKQTGGKIAVEELLKIASTYTLGIVRPMMESVTALNLGGWGRSLRIGEHYARRLLRMRLEEVDEKRIEDVARKLVFQYTHHLFPIDCQEADRIGLPASLMKKDVYDRAAAVVESCNRKDFVGFLSKDEAKKVEPWYRGLKNGDSQSGAWDRYAGSGHAQAQAGRVTHS